MHTFLLLTTLLSSLAAVTMTLVAWRVLRQERRRSEARVAQLAAAIGGNDLASLAPSLPLPASEPESALEPVCSERADDMFASAQAIGSVRGLVGGLAIGAFVLATTAATAVVWSRDQGSGITAQAIADPPIPDPRSLIPGDVARSGGTADDQGRPAHRAAAAQAADPEPLELIALGCTREADRLVVRGMVRTPPSSAALGELTAVVLIFSEDGSLVATGRAAVEDMRGPAAAERTFVVVVPATADAGRCRVSFRTADRVVPHVDRRSA